MCSCPTRSSPPTSRRGEDRASGAWAAETRRGPRDQLQLTLHPTSPMVWGSPLQRSPREPSSPGTRRSGHLKTPLLASAQGPAPGSCRRNAAATQRRNGRTDGRAEETHRAKSLLRVGRQGGAGLSQDARARRSRPRAELPRRRSACSIQRRRPGSPERGRTARAPCPRRPCPATGLCPGA